MTPIKFNQTKTRVVYKPAGSRILVLSPHFDDEIIGCGGVVKKHIDSGDQVKIAYLTDGSIGIPWQRDKEKAFKIRREESKKAMAILGGKDFYYLMDTEGSVDVKRLYVDMLSDIIIEYVPDLIYLPWFSDENVDHIKTNTMLCEVFAKYKFTANICAYEIWSPLIPNIIVDITSVFNFKVKALSCFTSQLQQVDYIRANEGLNRYRSMHSFGGKNWAEAFIYLKPGDYFKLMKS